MLPLLSTMVMTLPNLLSCDVTAGVLGHARSVMLGDAKANDSVTQPIDPNNVNRIGYLHDGRARTIDEAIRWHGGEAESSKQAYEALSSSQQAAMIEFLESL